MKKSIIYYHPRAIKDRPNRGSDLRVARILAAIQRLDYEVIVIAGDAKSRHKKIKQLKARVRAGLHVEYVYGESTNAPIMFADKKLLPSNFIRDYRFFAWLKNKQIPFGVFYRDVYWRFDFFSQQLAFPLNVLLKPMYYLDWYIYDKYCTTLFLPSETMNQHLPRPRKENTFQALPPGFDSSISPRPSYDASCSGPLRLLYVGGIEPIVYDISSLVRLVAARGDLHLRVCCQSLEWEKYRNTYEPLMSDNIELVHVSSQELARYYHESDLFMIVTSHSEYRDFAMPVKLFEAIGYSLPIVSMNQKEVANYIRSADIGWVLDDVDELGKLLSDLAGDRSKIALKHTNLLVHRSRCSWDARANSADINLSAAEVKSE